MQTLTDLMLRFRSDPIEATVAFGYLSADQVEKLNWEAFVKYIPRSVLVAEIHRREDDYVARRDDPLRKRVGTETGPLQLT